MPRILHGGTLPGMRVDQPCDDALAQHKVLTMCGSRISATGGVRLATLGCLIRVQDKLYGLTASHAFEEPTKSATQTLDSNPASSLDDGYVSETSDSTQFTDDEHYLVDDVEYKLDGRESSAEGTEPSEVETDAGQSSTTYFSEQRFMSCTIILPTENFEGTTKPDLDWALVSVGERKYQRPNAYVAINGQSSPVFFSNTAPSHPGEQRDVLVISSALNPRRGLLLPGSSFLGGINRPNPCQVWNVVVVGEHGRTKGNSGTLVVDLNTNEVYDHIVASNPLGEASVVPLVETLRQIEDFFQTDDVCLPDPLSLLNGLAVYNFEGFWKAEANQVSWPDFWPPSPPTSVAPSSASTGLYAQSIYASRLASVAQSSASTGLYAQSLYTQSESGWSRTDEQFEATLLEHYTALKRYPADSLHDIEGNRRPNKARDKLLRLSPSQFQELSTDVFDELQRRQQRDRRTEQGGAPPAFLLAKENLHPVR